MKNGWKRAASILGAVGAVGAVAGAASGLIKWFKPEARDLPAEHADQIREYVEKAITEREKKKLTS